MIAGAPCQDDLERSHKSTGLGVTRASAAAWAPQVERAIIERV